MRIEITEVRRDGEVKTEFRLNNPWENYRFVLDHCARYRRSGRRWKLDGIWTRCDPRENTMDRPEHGWLIKKLREEIAAAVYIDEDPKEFKK